MTTRASSAALPFPRAPFPWACGLLAAMLATLASVAPAAAQEPLGGAAFDERVTGRTLTFGSGGTPYGVEQYLPGRRVIWAFVGGPCRRGEWYEDPPGRICFVYDHDPAPQCWFFFDEPGGLRARFDGAGLGQDLIEVEQSDSPLICPGPDVGV